MTGRVGGYSPGGGPPRSPSPPSASRTRVFNPFFLGDGPGAERMYGEVRSHDDRRHELSRLADLNGWVCVGAAGPLLACEIA